jgi:hypothetical protein
VSGSISSKTSYVLAGADMGPAKRAKAEQLDVPVIDEDEFTADDRRMKLLDRIKEWLGIRGYCVKCPGTQAHRTQLGCCAQGGHRLSGRG